MDKDKHKTKVIFRKFSGKDYNTIIAIFPYESYYGNDLFTVWSYMHVGQHGPCDYTRNIKNTTPATYSEYYDLMQELESIGYNLEVISKRN